MFIEKIQALRGRFGGAQARPKPIVEISNEASSSPSIARNSSHNPYLEARREWNERYGDYIQQARSWRIIAFICGLIGLIGIVGLSYVSAQSKVIPYIVEVDKLGRVATVAPASQTAVADSRIVNAYLARFVADWRGVTTDRRAQKNAIDRVYSMLPSGSIALRKLNDFFKTNNPFAANGDRSSVDVSITNLLPISDRTWQVEWQEVTRDSRGEITHTVRMKVSIIVGITPPTDERLILINPLGVYVTDLNWSQQL